MAKWASSPNSTVFLVGRKLSSESGWSSRTLQDTRNPGQDGCCCPGHGVPSRQAWKPSGLPGSPGLLGSPPFGREAKGHQTRTFMEKTTRDQAPCTSSKKTQQNCGHRQPPSHPASSWNVLEHLRASSHLRNVLPFPKRTVGPGSPCQAGPPPAGLRPAVKTSDNSVEWPPRLIP
jgi:hypothetical protein